MSLDPPPLKTRFWKIKPPMSFQGTEAESLRLALARDESHIKALGLWCYLFGLLWCGIAFKYVRLFYLHNKGTILAPWITEPFWIATISLDVLIAGLALAAGHGLWKLRNWSLAVGLAYGAFFLFRSSMQLTNVIVQDQSYLEVAAALLVNFAYILPLAILFRPSIRTMLSPEYADAIRQTPNVRIRPRLPLWIKLIFLLALVVLILFCLSQPPGAHSLQDPEQDMAGTAPRNQRSPHRRSFRSIPLAV